MPEPTETTAAAESTPRKQRERRGREVRSAVPRSSLGEWSPASDRDPNGLLAAQDATRDQGLVPLRHERMAAIGQVSGVSQSSPAGRKLRIVRRDGESLRVEYRQLAGGNVLFGRIEVSAGKQFRGGNLVGDFSQTLHEIVGGFFLRRGFGTVVPQLVEFSQPVRQIEVDRAAIDVETWVLLE